MFKWYKKAVFENYANFSGRASRSEYWYFTLINSVIAFSLIGIDELLKMETEFYSFNIFQTIYTLSLFLPGLAVSVRRFHDIGKSGWMLVPLYLGMITGVFLILYGVTLHPDPFESPSIFESMWLRITPGALVLIGSWVWMLVLYCTAGNEGDNEYGSDPLSNGDAMNEVETV